MTNFKYFWVLLNELSELIDWTVEELPGCLEKYGERVSEWVSVPQGLGSLKSVAG